MSRSSAGLPALLALDWGTSSLRAWLMTESGQILKEHQSKHGILNLPEGGFSAVLEDLLGLWRLPILPPAIACGMVGSANGWAEAPYLACPVSPDALATSLKMVQTGQGMLSIIPGVRDDGMVPDVMRGEETQILGVLALRPDLAEDVTIVLPGTHSKWAQIHQGRIVGFRTFMTGELYAVLTAHSILGRFSAPERSSDAESIMAFEDGVRIGASGDSVSSLLFSARSRVLAGRLSAAAVPDYLSGLLIGNEVYSAPRLNRASSQRSVLVGDDALCARYLRAFRLLGQPEPEMLGNTAPAGLMKIAHLAGLVPGGARSQPFSGVGA